jgi:allophanate hydrolase subunit 2
MTATLFIDSIGPLASLQDTGRPGMIALGLSRGGAMDPVALDEAAALLGLPRPPAAIEMAGLGGMFRSDAPFRFALTGAPMQATIDGRAIAWAASHQLLPGQRLTIGGALGGTWGYLAPAAPILGPRWCDSVSAHVAAGIGRLILSGDRLPLGRDPTPDRPAMTLTQDDRFSGGPLRLMPGPQTHLFDDATLARFTATDFLRSPHASRQATRLDQTGPPFDTANIMGLISDFTQCGDVQITGGGVPFILMAECQTIGGYPRLGTIIAADLPRAAQALAGATLRFAFVDTDTADRLYTPLTARLAALRRQCRPLTRHPADVPDLLTHQLISGVTTAAPKDNP